MGWYTIYMVVFQITVGAILGTLAGLGIGGGSLLMLWLTAVTGIEYPQARIVNLLFFLPCALIATLFRWRSGSIKPVTLLPSIVAGCLSAVIGIWISNQIQTELIKKIFGGLLILCGTKELFYRPRKAK